MKNLISCYIAGIITCAALMLLPKQNSSSINNIFSKHVANSIFENITLEDLQKLDFIPENSSLLTIDQTKENTPIEDILTVRLADGNVVLLGIFYTDGTFKPTVKRKE